MSQKTQVHFQCYHSLFNIFSIMLICLPMELLLAKIKSNLSPWIQIFVTNIGQRKRWKTMTKKSRRKEKAPDYQIFLRAPTTLVTRLTAIAILIAPLRVTTNCYLSQQIDRLYQHQHWKRWKACILIFAISLSHICGIPRNLTYMIVVTDKCSEIILNFLLKYGSFFLFSCFQ